ncbi:MAG: DUF262 domain-containing protein [Deltaproteobacteria bacterium]|nr:DUF262 domain-containing protein [Deltaproteobacteria bacterium]
MSDQKNDETTNQASNAIEGYEPPTPGGWEGYPLDELAIRDERRTAEDVVRRIEKGRFILDPDFQRDFVWDKSKQSRLIESILMRIPLPVFYVAEDSEGRLIVVDGRQRLTTFQRFLAGDLKLDLEDRPDLNGKRFAELEPRLQNRVEDCQLHFYIIDHAVPERARLDIFERVNGGEVLTRQQMRNAIYNGASTEFLRDQANSQLFIEATGRSLNAKKMQDREFVNRFCSFSLLELDSYRGDMDEWLARGLTEMNKMDSFALSNLRERFERSLRSNRMVFGKHAFRKHKTADQSRSIINASLYDVMITGLADVSEDTVSDNADALRAKFHAMMDDVVFIKAITYGPNTAKEVRTRFAMAKQMFDEVFHA